MLPKVKLFTYVYKCSHSNRSQENRYPYKVKSKYFQPRALLTYVKTSARHHITFCWRIRRMLVESPVGWLNSFNFRCCEFDSRKLSIIYNLFYWWSHQHLSLFKLCISTSLIILNFYFTRINGNAVSLLFLYLSLISNINFGSLFRLFTAKCSYLMVFYLEIVLLRYTFSFRKLRVLRRYEVGDFVASHINFDGGESTSVQLTTALLLHDAFVCSLIVITSWSIFLTGFIACFV